MPPKKAAGRKRPTSRKPRALAQARPSRKKVSAARAARAVGTLAVLGTAIAAEKIKQAVGRGNMAAAGNVAKSAGKAALTAGLTAAAAVTAEGLARRR